MYQLVLFIHVIIAVCIIVLVLVQQGKGATMGVAFGSGASQTVFGSRGSGSFLFRVTIGFAIAFFATSISLNYLTMYAYKHQKGITLPLPLSPAKKLPLSPVLNHSNDPAQGSELPNKIPARQ